MKLKSSKKVISSLSENEIREELNRINYKNRYSRVLKSTLYSVIIIAAIGTIISSLVMPVLQISGNAMEPNYSNGDIVVSIKKKNLASGDVIAFYHGNKILVKRVIATAGEWVNIDKEGNIYINGKKNEEKYLVVKAIGETDIKYPYQVPNESYFVLSDDRSNNIDSRLQEIGSIKEEDIIGKVLFRVWPLS